MNQLFASSGQSIGAPPSASVLPVNIQGWFPFGLTGLISLLSKGLSRVFSSTTGQCHYDVSSLSCLWLLIEQSNYTYKKQALQGGTLSICHIKHLELWLEHSRFSTNTWWMWEWVVSHLHISNFQLQKSFRKSLILLKAPQGCDLRYFLPSQHLLPHSPCCDSYHLHSWLSTACLQQTCLLGCNRNAFTGNQQPIAWLSVKALVIKGNSKYTVESFTYICV